MRSFFLTSSFVCLLWATFFTNHTSAQLIVNGSFETPLVPNGSFTNYPGGSILITGWTVVGNDVSVGSTTFTQNGITFQAQSGIQWADLSGQNSNSPTNGLRQIVSTVVGQTYDLQFYVGSATGGGFIFPSTVDLSINGGARTSYFNPTGPNNMLDWRQFNVQFTATTTATDLTFFNGSASNNFLCGLDNVSLNVVGIPEPSTILLTGIAGIGAGGLVWSRWKKRRKGRKGRTKAVTSR